MTCAWAMMIDYQKIAMLVGGQSVTGQNLELNQKVGVSALADGQQEIAKIIGTKHSDKVNKFETISYINKENMILIENAKVLMECTVSEIHNLDGDLLVYSDVLDKAVELSSMGIRVDEKSLLKQLELSDTLDRLKCPYHQMIMKKE